MNLQACKLGLLVLGPNKFPESQLAYTKRHAPCHDDRISANPIAQDAKIDEDMKMNVGGYCLPRRNIRVSTRWDTQRIGCFIGLSS